MVGRNTCHVLRVDALRIPFEDLQDTSSLVFVKFGSRFIR